MTAKPTEKTMLEALRLRYAPPAYAVLEQVRNGTGFARAQIRTADALVMGIWPSRGLELWGVEIKVRRSDYLAELKNPAKADEIAQYCDRWYVAVADAGVIAGLDVPELWGVMMLKNGTLRCTRDAGKLKAKPVDRVFLAAIVRKVNEALHPDSDANRIRHQARQDGLAAGKAEAINHAREEFKDLADSVKLFEAASGVRIADPWLMGNVGSAVKLLAEFGPERLAERLHELSQTARFLHESADRALKAFRAEVPS